MTWSFFFFSLNTCSRLCIFLCTAFLLSEYFVSRKRNLNFSKKLSGVDEEKIKKKSLHPHVKLQTMTGYLLAFFSSYCVYQSVHKATKVLCLFFLFPLFQNDTFVISKHPSFLPKPLLVWKRLTNQNPQGSGVLSRSALALLCQARAARQHRHAYAVCDSAWKLGWGVVGGEGAGPPTPPQARLDCAPHRATI